MASFVWAVFWTHEHRIQGPESQPGPSSTGSQSKGTLAFAFLFS